MKKLLLVLLVLSGCAPDNQWLTRPVPVYLDLDASEGCIEAQREAIVFWAEHGVDYLQERTSAPSADEYGIRITSLPWREGSRVTGTALTLYNRVLITLYNCEGGGHRSMHTAAHEIGHALGLGHHPSTTNLMHFQNFGGMDLDEEQMSDVQ